MFWKTLYRLFIHHHCDVNWAKMGLSWKIQWREFLMNSLIMVVSDKKYCHPSPRIALSVRQEICCIVYSHNDDDCVLCSHDDHHRHKCVQSDHQDDHHDDNHHHPCTQRSWSLSSIIGKSWEKKPPSWKTIESYWWDWILGKYIQVRIHVPIYSKHRNKKLPVELPATVWTVPGESVSCLIEIVK